jgi:hypothetical protein
MLIHGLIPLKTPVAPVLRFMQYSEVIFHTYVGSKGLKTPVNTKKNFFFLLKTLDTLKIQGWFLPSAIVRLA